MSPTGKNWKLHSWQLVNYAPKIGALLKNVAPRNITKTMRSEAHTIRWWIEMIPFGAFDDHRFRDFVCVVSFKLPILAPTMRGIVVTHVTKHFQTTIRPQSLERIRTFTSLYCPQRIQTIANLNSNTARKKERKAYFAQRRCLQWHWRGVFRKNL